MVEAAAPRVDTRPLAEPLEDVAAGSPNVGEVIWSVDGVDNGSGALGRGKRAKVPSKKLRDYVTYTFVKKKSPSTASSKSSGIPYPIIHYLSCDKFSDKHRRYLAIISVGNPPKSFKEAMKHKDHGVSPWRQKLKLRRTKAHWNYNLFLSERRPWEVND